MDSGHRCFRDGHARRRVRFDCSGDATTEISRFFRVEHRVIIPIIVREILDDQIAHKLV